MPSRALLALIVAGWLASAGYFLYREVWPHIRPGQAPPYSINLADETTVQQSGSFLWGVYRVPERGEPTRIGDAKTRLAYREEDDTFELHTDLLNVKLHPLVIVVKQSTVTRVSRTGELRGITTEGELNCFVT